MVGLSCEVLVDHVEWVPTEEEILLGLGLAVGAECFVGEHANVEVDGRLEAFLLHPGASIA